MARTVHCIKLNREAEGLDFPPYPGELGKRIYENVSKEAWAGWIKHQNLSGNDICPKYNRITKISLAGAWRC